MSTKKGMFDKIEIKLKRVSEQKLTLFVGWTDKEMAKIAAIQEFGCTITVTPKMRGFLAAAYGIYLKTSTTQIVIPPRAHRDQVIEKNGVQWKKILAKILQQTGYDITRSLEILGQVIEQDYKAVIIGGDFEKLSDATLYIRDKNDVGGSQPLFATGEMQRTIESKVIKS